MDWQALGLKFDFCVHSARTKKGVSKSSSSRGRFVKAKKWVNARGFHSNNVESLFNVLKRWARKRNGVLPRAPHFKLYLSNFMLRHNCKGAELSNALIEALGCVTREEPDTIEDPDMESGPDAE